MRALSRVVSWGERTGHGFVCHEFELLWRDLQSVPPGGPPVFLLLLLLFANCVSLAMITRSHLNQLEEGDVLTGIPPTSGRLRQCVYCEMHSLQDEAFISTHLYDFLLF